MVSVATGSMLGTGLSSESRAFAVDISSTSGVMGATEACSALGAVVEAGEAIGAVVGAGVAIGIATAGIAAGAWVGMAGMVGIGGIAGIPGVMMPGGGA